MSQTFPSLMSHIACLSVTSHRHGTSTGPVTCDILIFSLYKHVDLTQMVLKNYKLKKTKRTENSHNGHDTYGGVDQGPCRHKSRCRCHHQSR